MSTEDTTELGRFVIFLRLIHQAELAGVNRHEAAHKLYPDVYEPDNHGPSCGCGDCEEERDR